MWSYVPQRQQTMKGDNSTWRQAVRPTGVAVDGRATVGGDNGDSVGGGATRTMSTSEIIREEPALLLL